MSFRAVCFIAAGVCLAFGASSCLLAYDFDDYGAGGGASNGANSGASNGANSGSTNGSSSSTGGIEGFPQCADGEYEITILPADWEDVVVGQLGMGFVAAPRDALEFLVIEEDGTLNLETRQSGTAGLLGITKLNIDEADRIIGVLTDSSDLKLKGFDIGEGSDRLSNSTFVSVRQFAGEGATILVTSDSGGETVARVLEPGWDVENQRPTADSFTFVDDSIDLACEGECELRNAYAYRDNAVVYAGYVGQAGGGTVVGGTLVDEGPFVAVVTSTGPAGFVLPLSTYLDEIFEMGPQIAYISGISAGRNVTLFIENDDQEPVTTTFGEGEARTTDPSRFAKNHWMATQFDADRPSVAVYETRGQPQGDSDPPVFEMAGARGFAVATAPRQNASFEGILVSAHVGPEALVLENCTLPADSFVLVRKTVAAAP